LQKLRIYAEIIKESDWKNLPMMRFLLFIKQLQKAILIWFNKNLSLIIYHKKCLTFAAQLINRAVFLILFGKVPFFGNIFQE
jgi:hypothetical protein